MNRLGYIVRADPGRHLGFAARCSEIVAHVHLKDTVGQGGEPGQDFAFTLSGERAVDWPGFLTAVDASDYTGPLMVGFESDRLVQYALDGDPIAVAKGGSPLVRGLLKHASGGAGDLATPEEAP
jgi:sugar phosphate isomerase/epimerase